MQMKCILSRHYAWSVVNFHFMLPSNARVCVCICVCAHIHMDVPGCALRPRKTPGHLFHYSLFSLFPWDRVTPWTQNWAFWLGLLGSKFPRSGHLSVFTPVMQRLQAFITMLGCMCILGFNPWLSGLCSKCACSSNILPNFSHPWPLEKCKWSLSVHYFPGVTGAGCHSQCIASILHHHPNLMESLLPFSVIAVSDLMCFIQDWEFWISLFLFRPVHSWTVHKSFQLKTREEGTQISSRG